MRNGMDKEILYGTEWGKKIIYTNESPDNKHLLPSIDIEKFAEWRGVINTRITGIDATVTSIQNNLKDMRIETSLNIKESKDDSKKHLDAIERKFDDISSLVKKIMGGLTVIAIVAPFVLPKILALFSTTPLVK
jgi:hypothetical protein